MDFLTLSTAADIWKVGNETQIGQDDSAAAISANGRFEHASRADHVTAAVGQKLPLRN